MKVIILTSACSNEKYAEIQSKRKKPRIDSGQKFFKSIAVGLKNNGCEVTCLVSLPVSYSTYPQKVFKLQTETVDGITYRYLPFINLPFFRSFFIARNYVKEFKKLVKKYNDKIYVLCDTLILEASLLSKKKFKNVEFIGVVTDIPLLVDSMFNSGGIKGYFEHKYHSKAEHILQNYYDKYIFLSSNMNEIVNRHNRENLVIECLTEIMPFDKKTTLSSKPVVLYAGKLLKDCGVLELALAAKYLESECEVWMYGSNCDCYTELEAIKEQTNNLIVHNAVPLDDLYVIEASSSILINPRYSKEDFAKYSFPSKTIEYMMSGVPTLIFKLPGIPDEYNDYVFYLSELSPDSIADSIRNILRMSLDERMNFGCKAREFVIGNKSCDIQCRKIIDFLDCPKSFPR